MDLELSDEQRWLSESVDTLLDREWLPVETVAGATVERRRRVWEQLVAFGALSLGGDDGIGAIEACLIARSLGAHLAAAPYVASAAIRLAVPDLESVDPGAALAIGWLEPGSTWSTREPATTLQQQSDGLVASGEKAGLEQVDLAEQLAIVATLAGEPALALLPIDSRGVALSPRSSFDATLPMAAAQFEGARVDDAAILTGGAALHALERLTAAGSLLAASEALGAADRILALGCRYATERRQFGRSIAGFQSLRHMLADMYVRSASGWSAVLYAAATFDEGGEEAAQTASIAKAYVSRGAREVAHGAMQVFGGIAFTEEHPAHRLLRRIVVREQQFGDATHHERALGQLLAGGSRRMAVPAT